jgi:hypothetical protein
MHVWGQSICANGKEGLMDEFVTSIETEILKSITLHYITTTVNDKL